MSKVTISRLARMSQREFVEIREALTEGLGETHSDIAALREELGALRAEAGPSLGRFARDVQRDPQERCHPSGISPSSRARTGATAGSRSASGGLIAAPICISSVRRGRQSPP